MNLRKLIPASLRLQYKLIKRSIKDTKTGNKNRFATRKNVEGLKPSEILSISQTIMKSYLYENKLVNISVGSNKISNVVINPNEIFSFWKIVKAPTVKNGFKIGRNLIDGQVEKSVGGGLCQLASIIYHLALTAGLKVIERTNHTVDIYKEEERFTPLGSDASVVYGYKDLRFINNLTFPIQLQIFTEGDQLTASIHSKEHINSVKIEFERTYSEKHVSVIGKSSEGTKVNNSSYSLP